ncbi:MAG TPA: aminotransferase class I/II-fold pyridoxal phosphate-dependent enzyme, partial [Sorangium sp.]|nr:aminotransferase class I/II-fold pyridoxal phosphate-dependent enzyme [Sorangium sp.]
MTALGYLARELMTLRRSDLLRKPRPEPPAGALQLCSNDYLGYAEKPWPTEAMATATGAGASRLVSGDSAAVRGLERALAEWVQLPAALVFTSGYAANVGLLSAIAGAGDVIVSDALNHASIIDGCRLSRAQVVVVPHLDCGAVEAALKQHTGARRRFVVTESYFSMDGDCAELAALRRMCDEYGAALLVDEAHALGVFGAGGRGCCARAGVKPDALMGTLGKSLGSQGAFVA